MDKRALRSMPIKELEFELMEAEELTKRTYANRREDELTMTVFGRSDNPWDRYECEKAASYYDSDIKQYCRARSCELYIRKLIQHRRRQYEWSAKRFKKE